MTKPLRLLLTASRSLTALKTEHRMLVIRALSDGCAQLDQGDRQVVLVHGGSLDRNGNRVGGDWLADHIWHSWCESWPSLFLPPEVYPAADYQDPKARNSAMVLRGANLCLALAATWDSGTGHCARRARAAGIKTIDYGVSTAPEDRPRAYGVRKAA